MLNVGLLFKTIDWEEEAVQPFASVATIEYVLLEVGAMHCVVSPEDH